MASFLHVSSSRNRASIQQHGLDWRRMGAAPGIAGSQEPEVEGVFVARDESEAAFFVRMNNTGGPVDVWEVVGVRLRELVDNGDGFLYAPRTVPPADVVVRRTDVAPVPRPTPATGGTAYGSTLTITFDDPGEAGGRPG